MSLLGIVLSEKLKQPCKTNAVEATLAVCHVLPHGASNVPAPVSMRCRVGYRLAVWPAADHCTGVLSWQGHCEPGLKAREHTRHDAQRDAFC